MIRALLFLLPLFAAAQNTPLTYVDPFIGTGGHGHTYPGATAPFGMVQLSPDTRIDMMDWDGCSGYHYSDSLVYGFSHTHLSGTGVADYCDILFMPFTGGVRLEPEEYASPFKKNREKAEAGYYSVFLERDRIQCELTATERVGVHRYSYPLSQEKGALLVDLRHRDEVLESELTVINDREIAGYRISKSWAQDQRVYFVARFNKPLSGSIVLDMAKNPREAAPSVNSKAILGLLTFYNEQTPLIVTVGISGTSIEGARRNLDAECPDFDFEKVKTATQEKWRKQLSKIEVEGGTEDQKKIFYTALYHTMIAPNIWSDVDGSYRGRDSMVHTSPGYETYTVFSLWDTHRALHPLLNLLEPSRTHDFVTSFLQQYRQSGRLPVWELAANETDCMIGNHSIPVITDAFRFLPFDPSEALQAMNKTVFRDEPALNSFKKNGYVEATASPESVSKTLEFAYDDWCIAQLAKAAGDTALYKTHIRRAQYYKNVFDPSTKFFRAKKNATWYEPFDPYEVNFNYTEANAWQYRFSAQQDINGLIRLMGGPQAFENQLDSLFSTTSKTTGRNQADITGLIGQYVQGNEPSHHIAYLYNYIGKPWKTQQRVRQIMDEQYSARPDGLSGNEDCGQMSAWYVFSAMGFYPVQPGSDMYVIGTPLFEKVRLHLEGNQVFGINAPGVSAQNRYIQSAFLKKTWFSLEQMFGGIAGVPHEDKILKFTMGGKPSEWGSETSARPVSEITDEPIVPVPFVVQGKRTFHGRQTVKLQSIDPASTIQYAMVQGEKFSPEKTYQQGFEIKESATVVFYAVKNGVRSPLQYAYFYKIPDNRKVRYNTKFSRQYTGGGDEALIDGIKGNFDFRTGDWQGFEGVPLDVVIDLGKKQKVACLSVRFLQDQNAWIFLPTKVQFEISDDGEHFQPLGEVLCPIDPKEKEVLECFYELTVKPVRARYLRVVAEPMGKCPDWHKGAGYPCWIFADEVEVSEGCEQK